MKSTEFLFELSPATLASYKKKAGAEASRLDKEAFSNVDDPKSQEKIAKANKRFSGIVKATKKEFDKSAPKEVDESLDEACWKGYHKEGNKKMFGKTYPNCVKNTNEEEQLDEKCWDTHKQVGMKSKGGKMVPNCVPKESAIMKGLQNESK